MSTSELANWDGSHGAGLGVYLDGYGSDSDTTTSPRRSVEDTHTVSYDPSAQPTTPENTRDWPLDIPPADEHASHEYASTSAHDEYTVQGIPSLPPWGPAGLGLIRAGPSKIRHEHTYLPQASTPTAHINHSAEPFPDVPSPSYTTLPAYEGHFAHAYAQNEKDGAGKSAKSLEGTYDHPIPIELSPDPSVVPELTTTEESPSDTTGPTSPSAEKLPPRPSARKNRAYVDLVYRRPSVVSTISAGTRAPARQEHASLDAAYNFAVAHNSSAWRSSRPRKERQKMEIIEISSSPEPPPPAKRQRLELEDDDYHPAGAATAKKARPARTSTARSVRSTASAAEMPPPLTAPALSSTRMRSSASAAHIRRSASTATIAESASTFLAALSSSAVPSSRSLSISTAAMPPPSLTSSATAARARSPTGTPFASTAAGRLPSVPSTPSMRMSSSVVPDSEIGDAGDGNVAVGMDAEQDVDRSSSTPESDPEPTTPEVDYAFLRDPSTWELPLRAAFAVLFTTQPAVLEEVPWVPLSPPPPRHSEDEAVVEGNLVSEKWCFGYQHATEQTVYPEASEPTPPLGTSLYVDSAPPGALIPAADEMFGYFIPTELDGDELGMGGEGTRQGVRDVQDVYSIFGDNQLADHPVHTPDIASFSDGGAQPFGYPYDEPPSSINPAHLALAPPADPIPNGVSPSDIIAPHLFGGPSRERSPSPHSSASQQETDSEDERIAPQPLRIVIPGTNTRRPLRGAGVDAREVHKARAEAAAAAAAAQAEAQEPGPSTARRKGKGKPLLLSSGFGPGGEDDDGDYDDGYSALIGLESGDSDYRPSSVAKAQLPVRAAPRRRVSTTHSETDGSSNLRKQIAGRSVSGSERPIPNKKRKSKPRPPGAERTRYCHQCRRATALEKMACTTCTRVYCSRCVGIRYPDIVFDAGEPNVSCPACNETCSCDHCTRKRGETYIPLALVAHARNADTYTPTPEPPERFVGVAAGQAFGTVYGVNGERLGIGTVDADRHAIVVHKDPTVRTRRRRVFVGAPRKGWVVHDEPGPAPVPGMWVGRPPPRWSATLQGVDTRVSSPILATEGTAHDGTSDDESALSSLPDDYGTPAPELGTALNISPETFRRVVEDALAAACGAEPAAAAGAL